MMKETERKQRAFLCTVIIDAVGKMPMEEIDCLVAGLKSGKTLGMNFYIKPDAPAEPSAANLKVAETLIKRWNKQRALGKRSRKK